MPFKVWEGKVGRLDADRQSNERVCVGVLVSWLHGRRPSRQLAQLLLYSREARADVILVE